VQGALAAASTNRLSSVNFGGPGLPAEDPELMPKDKDLQVLRARVASPTDQWASQESDDHIEEVQHQRILRMRCSGARIVLSVPYPVTTLRPTGHLGMDPVGIRPSVGKGVNAELVMNVTYVLRCSRVILKER